MTDPSMPADARPRSALPLLVALLALIVAGGALWMSFAGGTRSAGSQQQAAAAPAPDPAIEQIKQTLASLQQAVQGVQTDQQKLATQVSDVQQRLSTQQGDQKLFSDQLGSLSARVNSLESARAESPAAPQPAPVPRNTKRTKQ
ncbi:hypothetical protein [Bradyrhizobium sp. CCBAU 51753]|uniref:hypothetical protein n=1 Tax=Bradyrhizobium sp. CCBAU 51753 TaxID=1325100 RepID=UPI00188A8D48|nr:hypothetical protein [Bradyrhizobium sp. CCBAU 51753]QOZ26776.1 hypothetical protein XH93_26545 [Bradyrhizobium sp. CCBAU 51753]